jgi:predicted neuraminidase
MFMKEPVFAQLTDYPMAHCATLTTLPDRSLLTAWFGGSYETAPDVAILAARRHPRTEKWSLPKVIVDVPGRSLGQPVFLTRPNGELWLFFVVLMGNSVSTNSSNSNMLPPTSDWDWTSAQPYWQCSLDNGETWQSPQPLLDYPGLMFRSRPLVLPGCIILPVYDEKIWQSRMLISDDEGQTWRLTEPMSTPNGNIHPCLVQLSADHLLAYLRTGGSGGVIWRSESFDRGETWLQPTPTSIPNPNSGIDLLCLENESLVLAFNNSRQQRTPLCVALAEKGEVWQWQRTLEDEEAEFSYPTLLQTDDGLIHLVYTYRRENIHYSCFSESWLRKESSPGFGGI